MKRKISRIILIVLVFCLLCPISVFAKEDFSGSRKIIGSISRSDLENYVDGGRTSLNQVIVKERKEWLTCTALSQESKVFLTLEFKFSSYDDYVEKVRFLLGEEPVTTFGNEEIAYVENFLPIELFRFLSDAMQEAGITSENSFISMLHTEDSTINLGKKQYHGASALNTEDAPMVLFDAIELETDVKEDGYFRELSLDVAEPYQKRAENLLKQRADLCEAELVSGYGGQYKISFSAESEQLLIKKTMLILGTAVNISHEKYGVSANEIRLKTSESVDVAPLLTQEGSYRYQITLPDTYRDVRSGVEKNEQENQVYIEGQSVTYAGKDGIAIYEYNHDFLINEIVVVTDISDVWKRISRSVTIKMDGNLADEYTQKIRDELEAKMVRGDSFRIYDEGRERCFEVRYDSWFEKDIAKFMERILGVSNAEISFQRSMLPMLSSEIEEQWSYPEEGYIVENKEIQMKYLVSSNEILTGQAGTTKSNGGGFFIAQEYKGFYLKTLLLVLIFFAMVLVLCIVFIIYAKKRVKKVWQMWKEKHLTECPQCGTKREKGKKFCGKCGYKFK